MAPVLASRAARRPDQGVFPGWLLAVLFVIGTEVMFFAALVSAHLVAKSSGAAGIPPWQLRLPESRSLLNLVVLLASGASMAWGHRASARSDARAARRWLEVSIVLGTTFVALQGAEWTRLIQHGFTSGASLYGGYFYVIVGAHAVHACAGVALLVVARVGGASPNWAKGAALFWYFVVALWPVLYTLLY